MGPQEPKDITKEEYLEHMRHLVPGERIGELRAHPEAELIEKHDALVDKARSYNGVRVRVWWLERAQVYADELARREVVRQGERMEALTRSMALLTWVVTGATIIGVFLTAVTLILG